MAEQLYTASQAAERMGVHPATLRRWEARGLIRPIRTPGGHRRYSSTQLAKLQAVHGDR